MKNLSQMMKQAQEMQGKMQEMQARVGAVEMTGQAGAGYSLVGGHNNTLDWIDLVQGVQSHHHLYGRAVGVGDYTVVPVQVVRVYLRHHQGRLRVHSKRRAVVHHHRTQPGSDR